MRILAVEFFFYESVEFGCGDGLRHTRSLDENLKINKFLSNGSRVDSDQVSITTDDFPDLLIRNFWFGLV